MPPVVNLSETLQFCVKLVDKGHIFTEEKKDYEADVSSVSPSSEPSHSSLALMKGWRSKPHLRIDTSGLGYICEREMTIVLNVVENNSF